MHCAVLHLPILVGSLRDVRMRYLKWMGVFPSSLEQPQFYSRQTDYGQLHFSSLPGLGHQFIDDNAMSSGSQAAIFYAGLPIEGFLLTSEG